MPIDGNELSADILCEPVSHVDKKSEYDVKVKGVDISPSPVTSGKPATFSISATTGSFCDFKIE